MKQRFTVFSVAIFAMFAFIATPALAAEDTIVDIAVGNDDFSTLVDLVVQEGLVDTLAGEGPFTVFAPTNDAFAKLPAFINRAFERNPDLIAQTLRYHVVSGELWATDVVAEDSLSTVQSSDLHVRVAGNNVFVDRSRIVTTDIEASNGVVHVIDRVLIPNSVFQEVINDARQQMQHLSNQVAQQRVQQRGPMMR